MVDWGCGSEMVAWGLDEGVLGCGKELGACALKRGGLLLPGPGFFALCMCFCYYAVYSIGRCYYFAGAGWGKRLFRDVYLFCWSDRGSGVDRGVRGPGAETSAVEPESRR